MSSSILSPSHGVVTRSKAQALLEQDRNCEFDFKGSISTTLQRSPLQEIVNRPSVYTSAFADNRPSMYTARNTINGNDSIQIRLDNLEREKMEMNVTIHVLEEKDRMHRQAADVNTSKLKLVEDTKCRLEKELSEAKQQIIILENEINEKETMIRQLTKSTSQETFDRTKTMWAQVTSTNRELKRTEDELREIRKEKAEMTEKYAYLLQQFGPLKEKIAEADEAIFALGIEREKSTKASVELELVSHEFLLMSARMNSIKAEHEEILQRERQQLEQLREENFRLNELVSNNTALQPPSTANNNVLEEKLLEQCSQIAKLQKSLELSENQRRKLHNQLQELRGNIRVFVRCRPLFTSDVSDNSSSQSESCVRFIGDGASVSVVGLARVSGQVFSFDNVFDMQATQEDVYFQVSDLVQSALDGYRVCIFSYGQTGSGKTHTMTGAAGIARGIIPRAMEQIITRAIELQETGWEVSCSISMVELYNEELRDLMASGSSSNHVDDKSKLKIVQSQGRVNVQGLERVDIDTSCLENGCAQLMDVMALVTKNRTTAATNMNEQSSRSHVLFLLELRCHNKENGITTQGALRLVDLAGSERVDRTGTLGDAARLRETVNINKSLLCLTDVFLALSGKASHVPYRNSKLTMLLQDCLSGDGKAVMIANVSPAANSAHETFCSLKFASQVSKVELGKAVRNLVIEQSSHAPQSAPVPSSSSASTANVTSNVPKKQTQDVKPVNTNAQVSSTTQFSNTTNSTTVQTRPSTSSVASDKQRLSNSTGNNVENVNKALLKSASRRMSIRPAGVAVVSGRYGRPSNVFPVGAKRPLGGPSISTTTEEVQTSPSLTSKSLGIIPESNASGETSTTCKRVKVKVGSGTWR